MGRLSLHRHKWEYLGKDFQVKTKKISNYMSYLGGKEETQETNITIVRFFCRKCTNLKSSTVDGQLTTKETMKIAGYDLEKEE